MKKMDMPAEFQRAFGRPAQFEARAPGRVNLIGEHTDYNGGFVMPAAIERSMRMAAAPNDDGVLRLHSLNFDKACEIPLNGALEPRTEERWVNYFLAVIDQFQQRGAAAPGMDVVLWGDVPLGSGLSSSAAYEVCAASLILAAQGASMTGPEIALLGQAAEHSRFVGVKCGIMDQFISANGARDHALKLDCHDLSFALAPFDSGRASIVIIDSTKKRGLVDSEYNRRREECEQGLEMLRRLGGEEYETIRHIPGAIFEANQNELPEDVRKRIRHNLTENHRVNGFAAALAKGDFKEAGWLLYQSHQSLAKDYEVSCAELDAIVDIASRIDGVFGCRMTGAGFGGCCVALVEPSAVVKFQEIMAEEYQEACSRDAEFVISAPADGAWAKAL